MNARSHLPLFLLAWLWCAIALSADPKSDVSPAEAPLPEQADQKQLRSEEEADRVIASANFLQARTAQQRGDTPVALSKYERAWRYDPQNTSVLTEIINLATQLDRPQEARRYAIAAAEQDPKDQLLVRRLAILLSKEEQHAQAAKLFERALALSGDKGDPPDDVSAAYLLLELGRLHVKAGDPKRGAEILLRLRQSLLEPEKTGLGKDNVALVLEEADHTWALLGETLLQAGRLDEAEDAFRRADESKPNAAQLNLNLAKVSLARKDVPQGLEQIEKTLEGKFDDFGTEPFTVLEQLLKLKEPDPAAARQALRDRLAKLRDDHPKEPELAIFYAKVLREEPADLAKAKELYEGVLEKTPSAETFEGLLAVLIAQEDVEGLTKILGDVATKTGSLSSVGAAEKVLSDKDHQPLLEKIVAHVAKAVEDHPEEAEEGQSFAAGMLALSAGDKSRGNKLLEHAAEHFPRKSQVYLQWAAALMTAEDAAAAADVFQKMLDKDAAPRSAGVGYFYLAGALELAKRTDDALAAIAKAEKASADNPMFVHRRAWILYHARRNEEAEAAYRQLIKSCERLRRTDALRELVIESKIILSNIATKRDDRATGIEWLEQVLDEDPNHSGALNDLSYLWSERGEHLHRSLAMAQRAVEEEPDNAAYRDTLGWAYYQLGQYPAAERELALAAKDAPDGVLLDHWGDALHKLGRRDEARSAWQKAAEAFEKDKEPDRAAAVKKKLEAGAAAP